jgi:pyroglutamyl-peptidase
MPTLLITGFGPFPGAPFNPTDKLVRQLARRRRPAFANVKLVGHVFTTSYAAVDRDLPKLIAAHRPDALLMFGLHGRAKAIRIETRARNALALLPDVNGKVLRRSVIDGDGPNARTMPAPARRLLRAAQAAHLPARLSRDAGRYLCNYLCWRAAEAVTASGPRLAAFVHVPPVRRFARPKGTSAAFFSVHSRAKARSASFTISGKPVLWPLGPRFRGDERLRARAKLTASDLRRAGENILLAMLCAVNRA